MMLSLEQREKLPPIPKNPRKRIPPLHSLFAASPHYLMYDKEDTAVTCLSCRNSVSVNAKHIRDWIGTSCAYSGKFPKPHAQNVCIPIPNVLHLPQQHDASQSSASSSQAPFQFMNNTASQSFSTAASSTKPKPKPTIIKPSPGHYHYSNPRQYQGALAIGKQVAHHSHQLYSYKHIHYCKTCGNYTSGKKLMKLAAECPGPTEDTQSKGYQLLHSINNKATLPAWAKPKD